MRGLGFANAFGVRKLKYDVKQQRKTGSQGSGTPRAWNYNLITDTIERVFIRLQRLLRR